MRVGLVVVQSGHHHIIIILLSITIFRNDIADKLLIWH